MTNPNTSQADLALSPFMAFRDADAAIGFYVAIFGAQEMFRLTNADGTGVAHAELRFGQSVMLLSDEFPDHGALSPLTLGGSPVKLHLRVDDVDGITARAEAAGATILRAPKDEFYGERTAMIADPFGYSWFIAKPGEEVSPEEMQQRWNNAMEGM